LHQEYEGGQTAEAKFVKGTSDEFRYFLKLLISGTDLDRFEMASQGAFAPTHSD